MKLQNNNKDSTSTYWKRLKDDIINSTRDSDDWSSYVHTRHIIKVIIIIVLVYLAKNPIFIDIVEILGRQENSALEKILITIGALALQAMPVSLITIILVQIVLVRMVGRVLIARDLDRLSARPYSPSRVVLKFLLTVMSIGIPSSIVLDAIGLDPFHWANICIALFFGVYSVLISPWKES